MRLGVILFCCCCFRYILASLFLLRLILHLLKYVSFFLQKRKAKKWFRALLPEFTFFLLFVSKAFSRVAVFPT